MEALMNQTNNELRNIARAEGVPHSKLNKAALVNNILEYRATVGSLYRNNRKSLNKIAKKEKLRGYTSLSKNDLIQTILYHRRVVKPLLRGQNQLIHGFTKGMLLKQANKEGLLRVGRTKKEVIENLAMHRIAGEYDSRRHVINWVKYKDHTTPYKHNHAINEVFRTFRLKWG